MDGNGRWAKQRGLPRLAGHRAGTDTVARLRERASRSASSDLTVYAFSTENWRARSDEVDGLIEILAEAIERETPELHRKGVRIRLVGSTDGLRRSARADPRRRRDDRAQRADHPERRLQLRRPGRDRRRGQARVQPASTRHVDEARFARFMLTAGHPTPT